MLDTLTPLQSRSLVADCYRALKDAVLNLDLVPGAPLNEGEIAARLNISKTPVREALARLAGEGLVVRGPGRGMQVADLSVESIREIYQVRIMLESASLRQTARLLTDSDLAALSALIEEASRALAANDHQTFAAAGHRFHRYLIERSANRVLMGIADGLFDHVFRVRVAIFRTEQAGDHAYSSAGLENHRRILAALDATDANRAADLIGADIQMFLDRIDAPVVQASLSRLSHSREGGGTSQR